MRGVDLQHGLIPSDGNLATRSRLVEDVLIAERLGLVSVITATHDPEAPYLRAVYDSLLSQTSAEWEWLVQFDGPRWDPPAWLQDDARVKVEVNGAKFGIANTRNLALARAQGEFIQSLDSDDMLLPGALSRVSQALRGTPELGYALGSVHFLVDGELSDKDDHGRDDGASPPFGRIEPGVLYDTWKGRGRGLSSPFNFPMWRRTVLLAYGGWAAISTGEDFNVLFAVGEDYAGEFIDEFTIIYRQHEGSIMHDDEYWRISPRNRKFTVARLEAIRNLARKEGC